MSRLNAIRDEAAHRLRVCEEIPSGVALRAASPKDLLHDIEKSLEKLGIAIYVLPPITRAAQPLVPMVFFPQVELRIQIYEWPLLNTTGIDIYAARDAVMNLFQNWQPETGTDEPLTLAATPTEEVESDSERMMDVIFHFAAHLN